MEVSTWVTATIARLLGVVFGEIRAAAQARGGCHGERVARPSHVHFFFFFSTRFNRKIDTARPAALDANKKKNKKMRNRVDFARLEKTRVFICGETGAGLSAA